MENRLLKIIKEESFKLIEILDSDVKYCYLVLLGMFYNKEIKLEEYFVLKINKKEFNLNLNIDEVQKNINKMIVDPSVVFNNTIYYKFIANDLLFNELKIDLICPANTQVIDKYRQKGSILYKETYQIYLEKTKKYIESIDASYNQWIQNILYNNAEKILYIESNYFNVTLDYEVKDNENVLKCLGIPYDDSIKSLRDLDHRHLDLLERFYNVRLKLAEIFNVSGDSVRCFIHYPPSFYYFHVHYVHLDFKSESNSINRAWDLHSIIENIKMKNDYYQTVTLEKTVKIGSKLHSILMC